MEFCHENFVATLGPLGLDRDNINEQTFSQQCQGSVSI